VVGRVDQSGTETSAAAQSTGADDGTGPSNRPATASSLFQRLRTVYGQQADPHQKALMYSWAAFGATFGSVRAITHLLRWRDSSSGGAGGLVIRGQHLHHYNLGIAMLMAVGGIAVHGQESRRRHPVTSASYGAGAALIVDELAILLDVKDVYWAKQGRTSVDAAFAAIGLGGLYFAAAPFWHGVAREVIRTTPNT